MTNIQENSRPKWLDDAFITTCVKNSRNISTHEPIFLENVFVSYAVPKGENFLSVIYRVDVDFRRENDVIVDKDSYIVKVVPIDVSESLSQQIFEKEIDMYNNIIPKIQSILESKGLHKELFCRCIHYETRDHLIIVLEDLKQRGFVVADRLKGLDLQHCKLVLKKLAWLHASSMCQFHDKENVVDKQYLSTVFERLENNPIVTSIEEMVIRNCDVIINDLREDDKYRNAVEYFTKYRAVLDQINKAGVLNYKQGNKFNAINHGDCWTNNIMFKYDDSGNLQDAVFIDLQESNYSSVANDFNAFFFTSASEDVRRNHFSELQQFYLKSLVSHLETLGYEHDLPTLDEFKNETKQHGLMVMNVMTLFFAMVFMDLDEKTKGRSETEFLSAEAVEILVREQTDSSLFIKICRLSVDVMIEEGFFENTKLPEAEEDGCCNKS